MSLEYGMERNFGDKSLIELKSKLGKRGFLGDETKSGGA